MELGGQMMMFERAEAMFCVFVLVSLPQTGDGSIFIVATRCATASQAFATRFHALDPQFDPFAPAWPFEMYAHYYLVSNPALAASHVSYTPYGFSITDVPSAIKLKNKMADLINPAGNRVSPDSNSISFAMKDRLIKITHVDTLNTTTNETSTTIVKSTRFDLSLSSTPQAYPLVFSAHLHISRQLSQSTCVHRSEIIKL